MKSYQCWKLCEREAWKHCHFGVYATLRILTIGIRCQKVPSSLKICRNWNYNPKNCQRLKNFASVYGRAVRQRSVCHETTMVRTRTLLSSYSSTISNCPLRRPGSVACNMVHAATLNVIWAHRSRVNQVLKKAIEEEGNDKFVTEESDAAAADDDHDDETRTPGYGRYDGWCAAVGTWSSFSHWADNPVQWEIYWMTKLGFKSFKNLNSWTANYGLTGRRLSPMLYKNYTRRRLSVQQGQTLPNDITH